MKKTLYIILAIVAVVGLYVFSTYNRLVSADQGVEAQWSKVEVQYQRRFDLIPNLVNATKGVMKQEQAVFTAIADARTRYAGAQTVNERAAAASQVESALGRLLVITENYPQLKSSEAVQTLMTQLEGTENRVSVERTRFNDSVNAYNLIVKRAPSSLVAGMFGFDARTYFEADKAAASAPKVEY